MRGERNGMLVPLRTLVLWLTEALVVMVVRSLALEMAGLRFSLLA